MSGRLTSRVRWLAARDGTAHCRVGNAARCLCGTPALDERFAWPETARCLGCRSVMATPPDGGRVIASDGGRIAATPGARLLAADGGRVLEDGRRVAADWGRVLEADGARLPEVAP